MYLHRTYYDLVSGSVIFSVTQQGKTQFQSQDADFKIYPYLKNRTINDTGCIEYTEYNTELEYYIKSNYIISVDITTVPHKLIFTEKPPEKIDNLSISQKAQAYDILVGEE